MIIGLCGCMAGLEHVIKKLEKSYPFVDIAFGTSALDRLPILLYEKLNGKKKRLIQTNTICQSRDLNR